MILKGVFTKFDQLLDIVKRWKLMCWYKSIPLFFSGFLLNIEGVMMNAIHLTTPGSTIFDEDGKWKVSRKVDSPGGSRTRNDLTFCYLSFWAKSNASFVASFCRNACSFFFFFKALISSIRYTSLLVKYIKERR